MQGLFYGQGSQKHTWTKQESDVIIYVIFFGSLEIICFTIREKGEFSLRLVAYVTIAI